MKSKNTTLKLTYLFIGILLGIGIAGTMVILFSYDFSDNYWWFLALGTILGLIAIRNPDL